VVTAALLFIPLTLLIALIVPGNIVLPFGDLATIGFFVAMAVGVHRGNLVRTIISGFVIMFITIWVSSQMVDLQTELAKQTNLLHNAQQVGSLDQGGSPITFVLAKVLSGQIGLGLIAVAVVYIGCFVYTFVKYRRGTLYPVPAPAPAEVKA
jgi:PTS system galactitol-specific IIC component